MNKPALVKEKTFLAGTQELEDSSLSGIWLGRVIYSINTFGNAMSAMQARVSVKK